MQRSGLQPKDASAKVVNLHEIRTIRKIKSTIINLPIGLCLQRTGLVPIEAREYLYRMSQHKIASTVGATSGLHPPAPERHYIRNSVGTNESAEQSTPSPFGC